MYEKKNLPKEFHGGDEWPRGNDLFGLGIRRIQWNERGQDRTGRRSDDKVGRPVRITSISFPNGLSLDEIAGHVDKAGSAGVDVIALPELCRGQNDKSKEDLHGPTVTSDGCPGKENATPTLCAPSTGWSRTAGSIPWCFLIEAAKWPASMTRFFRIGMNLMFTPLSTWAMKRRSTMRISECWDLPPVLTSISPRFGSAWQTKARKS